MLALRQFDRPLSEILKGPEIDAERELEFRRLLRPVIIWQEMPAIALTVMSGVFVPPHERIMLDTIHRGAVSNVVIGSRGTSKTSTVDVLYAAYKATLWKGRKGVILSASGFRGGQLLFNDMEKWIEGAWDDQESDIDFIKASLKDPAKPVYRAQNFWRMDFTSTSDLLTLPTNDPEKLRGNRAHDLYLDERNFMDDELVDKVASSFTNVQKGMRSGGEESEENTFFHTTTIDYAWREFNKTQRAAYDGLRREVEALHALSKRDWVTYQGLEAQKIHRTSYVCIDYTDTIVRRYVTNREGKRFEIRWPDKTRKWIRDTQGIPYSERGDDGRVKQLGSPVELFRTYPINRSELEGKLLSGESSEAVWLSEQRNVVDSSVGDVYPHQTVDLTVCKSGRYVIPWADAGSDYQKRFKDQERHFVPPVLWTCSDPCVLGVDYAPGNRDFCAFVVIRIGPMAQGEFNPATGEGRTTWSNVVWVEQHRNSTGENVAEKIRALANRYNLVYFDDPYETDTYKLCRAIGLDVRGGGNAVRDALVFINQEQIADDQFRIIDPLDDDPRLAAFKNERKQTKPMLDAIKPTGKLNDTLVEFTLGQMQQKLLYLPADVKLGDRPMDRKYDVGYDGARILEHQLRALQQAPTASGYRKFFMEGDEELNKKDCWAAFIYAAKQLRAHLLRIRLLEDTPPPMGALVTSFAKGAHSRRAIGGKRL